MVIISDSAKTKLISLMKEGDKENKYVRVVTSEAAQAFRIT